MHTIPFLVAALSFAVEAAAGPLEQRAGACVGDKLLICFKNSATLASSFCSSTLGVATVTAATATATSTMTTVVTVTGSAPSQLVTEAAAHKRAATTVTPSLPACVSGAYTFDASRVTSACSCIGVTQATASVTYTAETTVVTETSTTYVSPVSTSSSTTSASATSPTSSACSQAGPVFVNGGFESSTNGWQLLGATNGNGLIIEAGGKRAHSGRNSLYIFTNFYNNYAPQSMLEGTYLATIPGVVYNLSFWVWVDGLTSWTATINGNTFVANNGGESWKQYSTTFTAAGADLFEISCASGMWEYAEFYFDDFVATPVSA